MSRTGTSLIGRHTAGTATAGTSPGSRVWRMPMGLDIAIGDAVPARLPREGTPGRPPGPTAPLRRLTARESGEYLFVGLRGTGGALPVRQPATDLLLGPGDICFYDVHQPPPLDFPRPARLKVFLLSRHLLGLARSDVPRLTRAPVTPASRLGALLSPFLSDFADTAAVAPSAVGDMLAWNAVSLLSTLAGEHLADEARGRRPDTRAPLMSDILDFIDLRLSDTDLSPETIARAHHISVRYLHKLFREEGTTVGRLIQRRRLAECRRVLTLRSADNLTIAAVAHRWGFASPTHFSRVFRATYGMSPSEWREFAGRGDRGTVR
ncbi:AraC family transcriptional regulator [Streptomyces argyrophyllae]|uniref:AraC family transcriptional regulator n=1 Tax=Streptomyces argyrophylli TaxID=2726118 RepID=A0A6M4PFE1_9ACTN|nr:AraC family transcriptional regulator [Streptomyces argyrophyllae]QJS08376.1 AraC family transcriptional regulator [Streptomyces argyrophyllae]